MMNDKITHNNDIHIKNSETNRNTIEENYHRCIVIANNKAHNLDQWEINPSSFLIKTFLKDYKDHEVAYFDFRVDNKTYIEKHKIEKGREGVISSILEDFSKNSNKKNAFKYNNKLGKDLFSIFIDYLNNEDLKPLGTYNQIDVAPKYTARFKNFERDLLVNKYPNEKDDIENTDLRDLVFASSEIMYVLSSRHLFILTYTATNEQYYNDKIKESNKAPVFSLLIYERDVEEFFLEEFEKINLLHNNFMQFIYSSDINQNVANAMGESSLVSQHWYTKSVDKILNDHKIELNKSKDSSLLLKYIVQYLLAADIENVNLIEVYPFDRVFMFNHAVDFLTNREPKTNLSFKVAEALIESKITNPEIKEKAFLGGKTRYAYEWEKIKAGLGLEKFNPSKKKLKFIKSKLKSTQKKEENVLINPLDKDVDTVINNIVHAMSFPDKENTNMMLEYQSKYVNNNIIYLYTSGTNLKTQLPSVYALQKNYLESIKKDKKDGIDTEINFEETYEKDFNFDNVKVVLFSYIPEEGNEAKGFTMLLVANQDVPKALMEQKAEKDDLHTALKLLVNQHFIIDAEYKEKAEKEREELIDILKQTEHTLKNSFDNFLNDENNFTQNGIQKFRQKVLSIIEQDRIQMEDYGRNAHYEKFNQSTKNSLANSLNFLRMCIGSREKKENSTSKSEESTKDNDSKPEKIQLKLNSKFEINSDEHPWDFFANEIFNLTEDQLNGDRIQIFKWTSHTQPKQHLTLRIDFNELQDFLLEYKESLFNDAIYVMLKNSCEHALETMTKGAMKKEIFLDIYISTLGDESSLNVEFTNDTKPLTKTMFDHINQGTDVKNNKEKRNSTGVGVVTIRKRLDVTYGLDKANIHFTMLGRTKIKSRLYVPIFSEANISYFKYEKENSELLNASSKTNILYLEDSPDIFNENIELLRKSKIECIHSTSHNAENNYKDYDLLITDLNIFGLTNQAKLTNGQDAIYTFTKNNEKGTVIVLSTDDLGKSSNELNGYNIIKGIPDIQNFEQKTIYLADIKRIAENKNLKELINHIYVSKENKQILESEHKDMQQNKQMNISFHNKIKSISELSALNKNNEINEQIFIYDGSDIQKTISTWEEMMVEREMGAPQSLANSEIPEHFLTRLFIKVEPSGWIESSSIKHEGLRRNIIFIDKNKTDKEIINIANTSANYEMPKKGIFSKISHDIIGKMKEFSNHSIEDIDSLRIENQSLRTTFEEEFEKFISEKETTPSLATEEAFSKFIKRLDILYRDAKKYNNHLGSSIGNINSVMKTLKYLRQG